MTSPLILATLALIATTGGAPLPAAAAETLRPDDSTRIARLDEATGAALRQALATAPEADVAAAATALRGVAQDARPDALLGDWSCRTIKLGGSLGAVAYAPFRCRISPAADGAVMLEKLSGSQRVRGLITRDGGQLVLTGVAYIAGDTPPGYADLPARIDPTASPQILAAPGVVEVTGQNSARILFPYPMVESLLDILVLSR